jgi:hypothetical protein
MSQSVKQFLHPEGWLSTRLRFNFIDVFLQSRRGLMIRCIASPLDSYAKENGHDRKTSGSAQNFIPDGVYPVGSHSSRQEPPE